MSEAFICGMLAGLLLAGAIGTILSRRDNGRKGKTADIQEKNKHI